MNFLFKLSKKMSKFNKLHLPRMENTHKALLEKLNLEANTIKDLSKNNKVCEAVDFHMKDLNLSTLEKKKGKEAIAKRKVFLGIS